VATFRTGKNFAGTAEGEPVEIIRPLRKTVRLCCPFVHGAELLLA
jgi:hypothetical protein